MKRLLIIVVILILLAGAAIGAVFLFTNGMANAATEFFQSVCTGQAQTAYAQLAQNFRKDITREELMNALRDRQLTTCQTLDWSSRSIHGKYGLLSGSMTTASGAVSPLTVELIKEDKTWKIYSIIKPAAGIRDNPAPMGMPSEQEVVRLVDDSMNSFARAVRQKSMQGFHDSISNLWQKQTTVADLDQSFQSFFALKGDMTVIDHFTPVFNEKPQIGENGALRVSGYYPTQPSRLDFALSYVYEGLGWKLAGINVELK